MRQTLADELAQHHRMAIQESLRIRKKIDDMLSKKIDQRTLKVREATTIAVQNLTEQAERVQSDYVKIKVKDDYKITRDVTRDMHVPLP